MTISTFREMDGSAKQIIHMSESLGLSAEEVVKIKAAIEEKAPTSRGVDASGSYDGQHGQQMRNYGSHGQMGGHFSSRQVPNARAKDLKAMKMSYG